MDKINCNAKRLTTELTAFIINSKEIVIGGKKMFGYVITASEMLTQQENTRWRGWYCGLCKALGDNCGQHSRILLNYDMTFLTMLLSSVYGLNETAADTVCFMHPLKKHYEIITSASEYAADMNLLLAYYKLLDDWHDDKNIAALLTSSAFKSKCDMIEKKHPRQFNAIKNCLDELNELEGLGEFNPDFPANCFGRLMGELFAINENDEHSNSLRRFGRTLGRFIYIIDAAADLQSDLKHERYNPLTAYPSQELEEMLKILGGDIMNAYGQLHITYDKSIIENILSAGIWIKYYNQKNKSKKEVNESNGKKSV